MFICARREELASRDLHFTLSVCVGPHPTHGCGSTCGHRRVSSLVVAPTNLTASVNGDTVALQWTAVSSVTSYVLEVGSFPGFADLAVFDTRSTATSVVAAGAAAELLGADPRAERQRHQ
jgi:hypothetical protein